MDSLSLIVPSVRAVPEILFSDCYRGKSWHPKLSRTLNIVGVVIRNHPFVLHIPVLVQNLNGTVDIYLPLRESRGRRVAMTARSSPARCHKISAKRRCN